MFSITVCRQSDSRVNVNSVIGISLKFCINSDMDSRKKLEKPFKKKTEMTQETKRNLVTVKNSIGILRCVNMMTLLHPIWPPWLYIKLKKSNILSFLAG